MPYLDADSIAEEPKLCRHSTGPPGPHLLDSSVSEMVAFIFSHEINFGND